MTDAATLQKDTYRNLYREQFMTGNIARLLATLCFSCFALGAHAQGSVHALLIAVDDYHGTGMTQLHGTENDIALMSKVLRTKFAVPSKDIRIVLNPTHSAIAKEFADLAARVKKNDLVYIHFSGHGSYAPAAEDLNKQDQTWVSFGARLSNKKGNDKEDVLDKELALWLKPLYDLSDDVVFVSDSCHSASVTKGDRIGVRQAPTTGKPHPLSATTPRVPPPTTGLRIGAARDFESAVELDVHTSLQCAENALKNCYGVFTWNWAKALETSQPGDSWGTAFQRAYAATTTNNAVSQRPQLEGRSDRAIFLGKGAPVRATAQVLAATADGTIELNVGSLSGATPGSRYRRNANLPDEAVVELTNVSVATSQGKKISGTVSAGDLLTEAIHVFSAPQIKLFVGSQGAGTDALELAAQVRNAVGSQLTGDQQQFVLVKERKEADWRIEIVYPKIGAADAQPDFLENPQCKKSECATPELWVVSQHGRLMHKNMRIQLSQPTSDIQRLIANLRKFSWAQEVRLLGAHGNATQLKVGMTILRPPAGDVRSCEQGNVVGSGWKRIGPSPMQSPDIRPQLNDCLQFQIENRDPTFSWYAYIVAVGPDFAVHRVWPHPNANADAARLPTGTRIDVTDMFYRFNQSGEETLLAFASDGVIETLNLYREGIKGVPKSAPASLVERVLRARPGTKGTTEAAETKWGAESMSFDVKDKTN